MVKHGTKYKEAAAQVDRTKAYEPKEAIELVKKSATPSLMKLSSFTCAWDLTPVMPLSR